jgi:hypothetical protein
VNWDIRILIPDHVFEACNLHSEYLGLIACGSTEVGDRRGESSSKEI